MARKVKPHVPVMWCELCKKKPGYYLSLEHESLTWYFTCDTCDPYAYWIPLSELDNLDWFRHIMSKGFNTESFMERFGWAWSCYHGKKFDSAKLGVCPYNIKAREYQGKKFLSGFDSVEG